MKIFIKFIIRVSIQTGNVNIPKDILQKSGTEPAEVKLEISNINHFSSPRKHKSINILRRRKTIVNVSKHISFSI
jgi:hypothetical protein